VVIGVAIARSTNFAAPLSEGEPTRDMYGSERGFAFRSRPVRILPVKTTIFAVLAVAAITVTPNYAIAQGTLAQRISRSPDGAVRLEFASRAGTCGDGRDMIGFRKALFAESFQSIGDWHAPNCHPGPVRVALSVTGGKITRAKTYVGGTSWPRTSERVTDLGTVSATEAAPYFFALVPQLGCSRCARAPMPPQRPDERHDRQQPEQRAEQ